MRHVPTGWKREREDLAMGYERLGLLAMRLLAMTDNDGLSADFITMTF